MVNTNEICLTVENRESSLPLMDKKRDPKLPKEVVNYFSALGRKGSRARAKKLSAVQRREIARKAAKARWASKTKRRKP